MTEPSIGQCGEGNDDFSAKPVAQERCSACHGTLRFDPRYLSASGAFGYTYCDKTTTQMAGTPPSQEPFWMFRPLFLVLLGLSVLASAALCMYMHRNLDCMRWNKLKDNVEMPTPATTIGSPKRVLSCAEKPAQKIVAELGMAESVNV